MKAPRSPEEAERWRAKGKEVLDEIEFAVQASDKTERQALREAGYYESYLSALRRSNRKLGHGPTLRVLSDLEQVLGVEFQITAVKVKGGA